MPSSSLYPNGTDIGDEGEQQEMIFSLRGFDC